MSMEKYHAAVAKMEAAKQAAVAECRTAFGEAAREFFAANPDITSFGWRQYTPYFNDGDECRFGIYCEYPTINGKGESEIEDFEGGEYETYRERSKRVSAFVRQFEEAHLEEIFGDHVGVSVSADGVTVTQDSDHD